MPVGFRLARPRRARLRDRAEAWRTHLVIGARRGRAARGSPP